MARIAVGGWQHETNTFSPELADLDVFLAADAWPGLVEGPELAPAVHGTNIPIAGFIERAGADGHDLQPLVWANATPSGPVTDHAFEAIMARLLARLEAALPVDAVYLDLHGAMVTQSLEDADGEILRRVRQAIGDTTPLVASIDFHANVSTAMTEIADMLIGFRTYPHIDMAETGARAAAALADLIAGRTNARACRKLPFLIPLVWQCTLAGPMATLMATARSLEGHGVDSLSFVPGFPLADVGCAGATVLGYGPDRALVEAAVDALAAAALEAAPAISGRLLEIDEAIEEARRRLGSAAGPIILVDTQDNPGAGGTADTVGILRHLIDAHLPGVIGVIHDPEAARAAHASGQGATVRCAVGARSGHAGERPVVADWTVEALGTGDFNGTGPFYAGCSFSLGEMAVLSTGDVRVVVSARRQQAADQAMFRHVGIEPASEKLLVLKSSVHFRADFEAIADTIFVVRSPGANVAKLDELPFRRLPPGMMLLA